MIDDQALKLKRFSALGTQLALSRDTDDLLRKIAESLRDLFGYRAVVISTIDSSATTLRSRAILGIDAAGEAVLRDVRFPWSKMVQVFKAEFRLGQAFFLPADRNPMLDSENEIPHHIPDFDRVDPDGWQPGDDLIIPLYAQERPLGIISLDRPSSGLRPTEREVSELVILANMAAAALEKTALVEDLEAALGERARLYTALNNMPDGLLVIDPKGWIDISNHGAEFLFGCSRGGLKDRSIVDLLGAVAARDAGGLPAYDPLVGTVTPLAARRLDGSSFPAEVSWFSFPMVGGHNVAAVVRDVSERLKIERLRNEFVAMVSHELRTPLTAIRGAIGLLAGGIAGELPPKALEVAQLAERNTLRLSALVDDILDLEKLQIGRMEMAHRSFSFESVVRDSLDSIQQLAISQDVTVEVGEVGEEIFGDRGRIVQVLVNLLSNAVKFSPSASVVRIDSREHGDRFEFRVEDHGRGIPSDRLPILFEPFRQVDASDSTEKGGTGLGLAICKLIVDAHDGEILVESQPGRGSTFRVRLPRPDRGPTPGTIPVLVLEDDAGAVDYLKIVLPEPQYQLIPIASVAAAKALLRQDRTIRLLLADVQLDGSNGLDLVRWLRSPESPRRDLPIVVLSGHQAHPEVGSLAPLVQGWVPKYAPLEMLVAVISTALGEESRFTILLFVEDSDLRRKVRRALSSLGLPLRSAVSAREAFAEATAIPPALLVVEVPAEKNLEPLIEACRQSTALQQMPLLLLYEGKVGSAARRRLVLGPTRVLDRADCSQENVVRDSVVGLLRRGTQGPRSR